ncbi:MAG: hypothetical protein HY360_19725 [Verrucomicrobia bacterium]|nr:hypothetical protein [Verrucomicrobiota bacterium]
MAFVHVLISEDVGEKIRILFKFGLIKAFEARQVRIKEEYVDRLVVACERIDVIAFGLNAFREDFLQEFPKWMQRASVRILLLDPEFPTAAQSWAKLKDIEEKNPEGKIAGEVKKFVEDAGHLMKKNGDHEFAIRLYHCSPSINIFRIDDDLFWGPYLVGEQSRNSPTFLVKRGGILFDRFVTQFERIWQSDHFSRPVPVDWIKGSTSA